MYRIYLDNGEIRFYRKVLKCGEDIYPINRDTDAERIKRDILAEWKENGKQAKEPVFLMEELDQPTPEQAAAIAKQEFTSVDEAQKFADAVMTGAYVPPLTVDDVALALAELGAVIGEVMSNG